MTLIEVLAPTATRACLVHIYPAALSLGRRYPLNGSELLVGRGDECAIRIQDNSVSRKHAVIEPRTAGDTVSDLGSTNGTFVNDKKLDAPQTLHDGDCLRIGKFLYRYLAGGNVEAKYHEEIHRLAIQDGLTGIPNHRALTEFLNREVARSQRYKRPLSVLIFSIDKFESINDGHGQLFGDFVLRELAKFVSGTVRQEDLFAHCGGEKFCLVLVENRPSEALTVAERVRAAIEKQLFCFEEKPLSVTISVGVATTTGTTAISPADLLRMAHDKLNQAKLAGRNRVLI